jgi:hypothetical protein
VFAFSNELNWELKSINLDKNIAAVGLVSSFARGTVERNSGLTVGLIPAAYTQTFAMIIDI